MIYFALLLYRMQTSMLPIIVNSSSRRHTEITPAITGTTMLVLVLAVTWLLMEDIVIVEFGSNFIIVADLNVVYSNGVIKG